MPAGFIRPPGNTVTGKKIRTYEQVVGADTVDERYVKRLSNPTHRVITPEFTVTIPIAGTNRIPVVTLWHPSTATKTVSIRKIVLHMRVSHTAGYCNILTQFLSAENAVGGGGTVITPQVLDQANTASQLSVRFAPNLPVRVDQVLDYYAKSPVAMTGGTRDSSMVLYESNNVEGITLRGGVSEGLEVSADVISGMNVAPIFVVVLEWNED